MSAATSRSHGRICARSRRSPGRGSRPRSTCGPASPALLTRRCRRAGARGRRPAGRPGRELVRDARRRLRIRGPGACPPGLRRLRPARQPGRPRLVGGADAPRLDAVMGRSRRRLADRSCPGGRAPGARDHGLRASGCDPRIGQHRRSHPEHRRARACRTPPRRAPPRRGRAGRSAHDAPRPDATGVRARRSRRRPRGDGGPPRRVDVPADPGRDVGPVPGLVHARALHDAPWLPAAPQPPADLRLVPLQQAQPAHPGGGRVPPALRPCRLP